MKEKSLGQLISILYRHGNSFLERELKRYNLGPGQFMFLVVLFKQNNLTQELLSTQLRVDKATTTRAINKLEEQGYVQRLSHPQDKRVNIICLTEKGRALEPIIKKISQEWTALVTKGLTEEEKEQLHAYLKIMAQNACEQLKNCPKD